MVLAASFMACPAELLATGPAMTQVSDTVYRADGVTGAGTVLISWPAFTTADGYAVAAGSLSVKLGSAGTFSASLAPNTGAQPAGVYYRVVYQLVGQEPSTEYWVVPATGSIGIGSVRAKLMPPTIAAQVLTRDVADSNYVHVSGDQTMNGAVTFSTPPTVPDPQKATDAVNKGYVDAATWNPARFSGSSAAEQINNALAGCSGIPCLVQIPPNLGAGWWTRSNPPATAGKYVLDWRQNGLNLWEDTADNAAGSAAGIGIHINNGSFPPINPIQHNPVGLYVEVNSDSQKYPVWAINPLVSSMPGADTEIIASEADVNNYTVDQPNAFASTHNRKFGYTAISAGTVPSTSAMFIGSAYLSAAWHHGITMQHVIDNVMHFFNVSVQITQAITGSPNPQTVSATSSLSRPEVGTWITLDSGSNQEDVQVTAVTATSISGIFRKNHASGLYAATYAGGGGINFSKTIFRQSPLILGDLQYTAATGSPHLPSVGLVNGSGSLTIPLYWDTTGVQHIRSVAASGSGFKWEDASGTQLESLAVDTGVHTGTTFVWTNGARVSGSDMNNVAECGYYDGNNLTNAPPYLGSSFLHFQVICSEDPNYLTQVAFEMTSSTYRSWMRQRVAGTWAAWVEVPNTTNVNAVNGTFTNLTVTGTCSGCGSGSGGSGDLSSLLGMALDYAPALNAHDQRRKIGVITEAEIVALDKPVSSFKFRGSSGLHHISQRSGGVGRLSTDECKVPQGLKPGPEGELSARLKSCPDAKPLATEVRSQIEKSCPDATSSAERGSLQRTTVCSDANQSNQSNSSVTVSAADAMNHQPATEDSMFAHLMGVERAGIYMGSEVLVSGFLYAHDFADVVEELRAGSGTLGMSYEITDAMVVSPASPIWTVTSFTFTGAAVLRKESAAYPETWIEISN